MPSIPQAPASDSFRPQQCLVYISSGAIHSRATASMLPAYTLTKQAGQLLIQTLADEADPTKLQVISYHPGAILSESARNSGLTEDTLAWDDGKSEIFFCFFFYLSSPISCGLLSRVDRWLTIHCAQQ